MTLPFEALNMPTMCVIKEMDLAHEEIINGMVSRSSGATDTMVTGLINTAAVLGLRTRCMCQDALCNLWGGGHCQCNGNPMCRELSYEIRLGGSAHTLTATEMAEAERQVSEADRARDDHEQFIVWKVRAANLLYQVAARIRNAPEDGVTKYLFDYFTERMSAEEKMTRFKGYIRSVRDLRSDRNGLNYSLVVGCYACNKTFFTEAYLFAHIDKKRFELDPEHSIPYLMVTLESVLEVRATSITYRPPVSRPILSPDPFDSETRDEDWSESEWHDYLTDAVLDRRDGRHSTAVACVNDGQLYETREAAIAHVRHDHDRGISDDDLDNWMIDPQPR
jgi:hypothetical protein